MNWILLTSNLLCLTGIALLWYKKDISVIRLWYWPTLMLHVLCGFAIGALYLLHYKHGDTLHYFDEAMRINKWAYKDFSSYLRFMLTNEVRPEWTGQLYYSDARALFMAKLTSISTLLSGENYWISTVHFSFLSFAGAWWFSTNLVRLFKNIENAVIFSFLLFPSVMFWTSGLVKESISMGALYFFTTLFIKLYNREKVSIASWLLLPIATWVLYMLKYYYLAVLMPVLITTLLHNKFVSESLKTSLIKESTIWLVIFFVLSLSVTQLHPNFEPNQFLWALYHNYQDFISFSQLEDVMTFPLQESWRSVAINSPWAIVSGLFRPFFWESSNILQIVASIENLILLILTVSAVPAARSFINSEHRVLMFGMLVYCFILSAFLALSTPNFGTLIRYRVGFIPFFIFLICVNNPIFKKMTGWFDALKK